MSGTFKVGDSVSIKKDPTHGWLVVEILPDGRYKIMMWNGRTRIVREDEIEPSKG